MLTVTVMFATKQDIIRAQEKLLALHKIFEKPCEQDVVADFATCLKPRLRPCTAFEFLTICDKAADDLLNSEKVSETYDRFTVGRMKDLADTFARELFGKSFAEEVKQFMDVRELV